LDEEPLVFIPVLDELRPASPAVPIDEPLEPIAAEPEPGPPAADEEDPATPLDALHGLLAPAGADPAPPPAPAAPPPAPAPPLPPPAPPPAASTEETGAAASARAQAKTHVLFNIMYPPCAAQNRDNKALTLESPRLVAISAIASR